MGAQWIHYAIKHSFLCLHVFSFTEHAIGAPDVAVSFELQANPEGQEGSQEVEVQQVRPEEPEEEVECPSHEPASFVKGKPRSILSLPLLSKGYLNMLYLLMH